MLCYGIAADAFEGFDQYIFRLEAMAKTLERAFGDVGFVGCFSCMEGF